MSSCVNLNSLWSRVLIYTWWSVNNLMGNLFCVLYLCPIFISFLKVEPPKMLLIPLIIAHSPRIFTERYESFPGFNRLIIPLLVLGVNVLHVVALRVLKTIH